MRLTTKRKEEGRKSNYITDMDNVYVDELDNGYKFATGKAIEKLGQLEDNEEELKIDLILFSKIIKQQFVFMKIDEKIISKYEFIGINFNQNNALILYNEDNQEMYTSDLYFEDYGITWALTKEELL